MRIIYFTVFIFFTIQATAQHILDSLRTETAINTSFSVPGSLQEDSLLKKTLLSVLHDTSSNISPITVFNISSVHTITPTHTDTGLTRQQEKPLNEIAKSHPLFYSLIIGINDYTNNNERLGDLSNAVHDANTLRSILTTDFCFQNELCYLLENPTRQEVIQQLEVLAAKITDKDNLLIFYAGHGIWDPRIKIGYWLPADARTNDKSSWISNSTIRDYISGINSRHTLLITDACFGGSILKSRDLGLSDLGMANLYRLQSRKAMTSGSLSTVPDDSKFMYYFLKRLKDTEGKYISARQLFYGLETAVLNNSACVPQFGVIQDTGDEGGDFIFIRR